MVITLPWSAGVKFPLVVEELQGFASWRKEVLISVEMVAKVVLLSASLISEGIVVRTP